MGKTDRGTVVVTGASSGIGREFALALGPGARRLVLVARREDRLRALADQLTEQHRVPVDIVTADLSTPDGLAAVVDRLGTDEIDVLVNNAGFATHGRFTDEDPARIRDEVALNVTAVVGLARAVLPGMVRRGRGTVINVASTAAFQPIPFMAVYGATKAFVLSFSEALWGELVGSGVTVLALAPGATSTEFFDHTGDAASVGRRETPQQVVSTALRALRRSSPPPSVVSGRGNALSSRLPRLLPRRSVVRITRRLVAPTP
jgi:hypothetical protein